MVERWEGYTGVKTDTHRKSERERERERQREREDRQMMKDVQIEDQKRGEMEK